MSNNSLSDMDPNAIAFKCGEVVKQCLLSGEPVTAEAIYKASLSLLTLEEKEYMAAMYIADKLKAFSKEQEQNIAPFVNIVDIMSRKNNPN